jgi:DNA-binding FadR family transcriptional regulator
MFRAFRDAAWDHSESHNDLHRLATESSEHLAIVEALLAGNRPGAVRAMSSHIASGMTYWCRALPDGPTHRENPPVRVKGER